MSRLSRSGSLHRSGLLKAPEDVLVPPEANITLNQTQGMSINLCDKPCCKKVRSKLFSSCLSEGYCSPECQLEDWKIHKKLCPFMKNKHQFNVKERKRVESLDKEQIEKIYVYLSQSGSYLGAMLSKSGNYKKACDIFDQSISFAYLVERKETRIDLLNVAFTDKGFNFSFENKFNETKVVFEEMYNVFVEAYYPDHSKVLEAANKLISILIDLKEFEDAERYARISYECLTRPVDTESNEVASAAESLATVTFKLLLKYEGEGKDHGDITEAEMLVRKALRIREKMFGRNHVRTLASLTVLSEILQFAEGLGNHYDEINDISGRILAIHTKRSGAESQDVASENNNIAIVHYNVSEKLPYGVRKNEQICIAEKYAKEAVRISTKINGPSHPQTMKYKTLLSNPRSRFQYSPY